MSARLEKIISDMEFSPGDDAWLLETTTKKVMKILRDEIKKSKMKANAFVGGSYAKGTLIKKNAYDIDIFIRFDKESFSKGTKKLKAVAEKLAKKVGSKCEIVHGSRDYYRIETENRRLMYELIPAIKVKKPDEAENVMDLSYFHVAYINKKLTKKMRKEVQAAKSFCSAQGVYGAESYIQGFSGYAIECLICHYKTLGKMLKALTEKSDKIFIDTERHYKNKHEAFLQMNESKLQSPVVAVDPTWKKRNILASLNFETFIKFQEAAREMLRRPSKEFFIKVEHTLSDLTGIAKDLKADLAIVNMQTGKQEGDIAGTKMKKALRFIIQETGKRFTVLRTEFAYREGQEAIAYIVAKSKRAITLRGPPTSMKEHADKFRKEHKRCFEKGGKLYAIETVDESLKEYLKKEFYSSKELKSMAITKIDVK